MSAYLRKYPFIRACVLLSCLACAGLGGQVDLKAGVGQDFERVQGLGVEEASLETARIDSTTKTRDRNQGFAGKGLRHVSVLPAAIDSMTPAVQVLQS